MNVLHFQTAHSAFCSYPLTILDQFNFLPSFHRASLLKMTSDKLFVRVYSDLLSKGNLIKINQTKKLEWRTAMHNLCISICTYQ